MFVVKTCHNIRVPREHTSCREDLWELGSIHADLLRAVRCAHHYQYEYHVPESVTGRLEIRSGKHPQHGSAPGIHSMEVHLASNRTEEHAVKLAITHSLANARGAFKLTSKFGSSEVKFTAKKGLGQY